jgi:hypothetical protein
MTIIPLKIFIHGLIALVPGTDPMDLNHMTALLINGRHPPEAAIACMHNHEPKLTFVVDEASAPKCGEIVGCELGEFKCICGAEALKGKEISLKLESDPDLTPVILGHSRPGREVPEDATEAGSFSYVGNLAAPPFGLIFKDDFRTSTEPPPLLLSRFFFPFQAATACSLVTRENHGVANLRSLALRRVGQLSRAGDYSSALAQRVVVELSVSDETPVHLLIRNFDGTAEKDFTLSARKYGYRIEFSNEVEPKPRWDDPCDDGIARHFAHYYGLAENAPEHSESYLIPHVLPTLFREAADMEPAACIDKEADLSNHPICPVASFFVP